MPFICLSIRRGGCDLVGSLPTLTAHIILNPCNGVAIVDRVGLACGCRSLGAESWETRTGLCHPPRKGPFVHNSCLWCLHQAVAKSLNLNLFPHSPLGLMQCAFERRPWKSDVDLAWHGWVLGTGGAGAIADVTGNGWRPVGVLLDSVARKGTVPSSPCDLGAIDQPSGHSYGMCIHSTVQETISLSATVHS